MTNKQARTHLLVVAVLLFTGACLAPQGPADPVFPNMRMGYESQIKSSLTNVEAALAQFEGARSGLTPSQQASPRYKSLVGRHEVIVKQYNDVNQRANRLLVWAIETEPTATEKDRYRLQSEALALEQEMANLGSSARSLEPEVSTIQLTVK